MDNNKMQSFVRWQERSIAQLGFVNNLLILLATGMLAFQVQLSIKEVEFTALSNCIILLSIIFIFVSMAFGCYLALNRLRSFRLTARISRMRETRKMDSIGNLRKKVKAIDDRTWCLLYVQTILFGLGALLLVIFAIIHFIYV